MLSESKIRANWGWMKNKIATNWRKLRGNEYSLNCAWNDALSKLADQMQAIQTAFPSPKFPSVPPRKRQKNRKRREKCFRRKPERGILLRFRRKPPEFEQIFRRFGGRLIIHHFAAAPKNLAPSSSSERKLVWMEDADCEGSLLEYLSRRERGDRCNFLPLLRRCSRQQTERMFFNSWEISAKKVAVPQNRENERAHRFASRIRRRCYWRPSRPAQGSTSTRSRPSGGPGGTGNPPLTPRRWEGPPR